VAIASSVTGVTGDDHHEYVVRYEDSATLLKVRFAFGSSAAELITVRDGEPSGEVFPIASAMYPVKVALNRLIHLLTCVS
jgi:hypothetical protein